MALHHRSIKKVCRAGSKEEKATKTEIWFRGVLDQYKDDLEFRTEGVIYDFTEKIVARMEELNINRSELIVRLGVSKPFITKLLNGNPNLTIKTMMTIADVLGCELSLDLYPRCQ